MLHYSLLVVLLCAAIPPSLSYPYGADPAACTNGQVPAGHGCASSSIDSAIVLSSPSTSWAACSSLSLTIQTGSSSFRGYLLSAFPAGTNTQRLGSFSAVDGSGQTRCAVSGGSAITHVDSNPKQNYGFTWTPPDPISAQTLDFISTIVQQSACQWNYIQLKGLVHQASLVPPQLPQTIAISGSSFDAVNQLAQVVISWTGSVSSFCQGNAAVQFFSLQVKGGNWTSFTDVVPLSLSLFNPSASTSSATIPLPLGFSFTLRLFANSTVGASISSTLAVTTPASASNAPPSPPATISLVSSTSTSLTLNWTEVANVLSYTLQMSAGSATGPFQTIYTGTLPSFTATRLSASVLYYFQVSSIALSGSSSFSSIFSFATSGCPQLCNGAGTCDTISFTCICNPQTFGQYCQFAAGSGAAPTPMSPQVSLGFFYDTTAANVYFRALLFDLPDGGSVSITLTPGLNIGGTNPRVYRLQQLAWRNSSDASLAVVTLSEYYLVPSGKMLAADNTHATLIAAYSKRVGQRQYVDVQWVRPAALNSIDSTDISIHPSLCFVNASCGYFSVAPFGVESQADATGSLFLSFNGGTDTASNGYSGNPLPTTAPLSFVHASDYALAYYISGSNIYFQIAIFNLQDGNFAALMFGAEDGMTNAYGVLLAFGTDAFAAPSLTKVSLSEISSKTFNTPTLTSQSNVQVLNVSAVQLAGKNGVLVEFVRPLATTNSLDKVFVPGQNMFASYALFRTSQWGDRHSHGDAGQLILQLPKQGFGGIIVVTRDYMWQVYLPVIVSLGVIVIIGFVLSRDYLHSPVSSFSSFLSYVYHTRPYPFAPNVSATGQKYSWFDFFTLSARHALFDWTLVEYGVLAVYGAALGTFIVLGGKRFGDHGGDGLTFFYFIYGHCAAVHLALTIIPMQRHSPLLHLLGLPFERALKWHRYLGRMTVAFVWVHFITMLDLYTPGGTEPSGSLHVYSPICGFAAFLCINVQWLVSLDFIRRRFFEFFYSIHVLLGPAIVALAAIHVDYFLYYMIAPASFYAANLFLRWRSGRRTVSLKSIALLTPHIAPISKLELQIEDFRFEAGQYVLVSVADLGFSEEHPLSITSAPALDGDSSVITLHALAVNSERRSWTARLAELASKSETFQVSIDGPFGRPSVAYLHGYSQIVLASGGIGATPMLSIALYLAQLADAKRLPEHIKAIHFLWVSRHSECFHQWFPDELHQLQRLGTLFQFHLFCTTPADGVLLTSPSPAPVKRQPVNVAEKRRSRESRMDGAVEMASPDELLSSNNRSPDVNQDNVRVQMSQSTDITEQKNGGIVVGWKPTITFGRPDLEVLFGHVQGSMQGKVCVLTCGPLGLMNGVQMAANKYGMHLHKETFYF